LSQIASGRIYGYLYSADVLHWAFAIEFSTLYLTSRFTGGPPKEEPLDQLVPLIEFPVDTTIKGGSFMSAATMNPGLCYVGVMYQIPAEVIVPLDRHAGHGVGATAGLEAVLAGSRALAVRPTRVVLSQLVASPAIIVWRRGPI
jgi:hypothetical protein